jgi:hypothetical protein
MEAPVIDDLIELGVERTRLDAGQVRATLAGALGLLDKHAAPETMARFYAAVPGAEALATSPEGATKPGGGLFGGLMKSAGGVSGAAIADAMGLLGRLQKAGVEKADLKTLLPIAEEWVRVRTGADLMHEALATVPGVAPLLEGRRRAASAG